MSDNSWEPTYGFCATSEHSREALARTLEAIRRSICAYGGGDRCDCKYGLTVPDTYEHTEFGQFGTRQQSRIGGSEQTGCPELREMIHRLLHRDFSLI